MGSPEEAGIVDWGVGSIVWVRRRNGSWWPGKILGPDELSAAHLMSPRSGTPVKLLGREDASVDWYNLEKSKRVKAFRCGEFDECIERAETSLGMPPKKREKYARREDAILHALELEKQLLDDKAVKPDLPVNDNSNKSSDVVRKELLISSECSSFDIGKDSSLQHDSKKLDTECEGTNIDVRKVNGGSQMGGDEDNSELLPRMRGLQDFGPSTSSKRKLASSTSSNGSRKHEHDNFDQNLPIRGLLKETAVILRVKNPLTKKRKQPSDVLTDEYLVRRRDKRRPLVQVLQSSEKLRSKSSQLEDTTVPSHISGEECMGPTSNAKRSSLYLPSKSNDCSDKDKLLCPDQMEKSPPHVEEEDYFPQPSSLLDESGSESTESTETDTSETESINRDGDDEMVGLSDSAFVTEREQKSLGISGQVRPGSSTGELQNDDYVPHDPVPASLGGSKWQIKGKRNNRSLSRRPTEATDGWVARGSLYGPELEEVESYGFDETDIIERNFRTRRRPFYNQGYFLTPKAPYRGYNDGLHNIIDWEDLAWNERPFTREYLDGPSNYLDPIVGGHRFGGRIKSGLVDVDLKVQSSYQREHVPMISLMSKLNGQAIVGHPIQVEVLESGSSDSLILTAGREISDNDIAVPAAWRTARRTANFRVPRSHTSTAVEDEEDAVLFQNVNRYKKTHSKRSAHKASGARKGLSHGKISRKRPKASLSSSQKIKNLSSIVKEQKLGNNFRDGNKTGFKVGSLMKGEPGPTAVACIPVKLVFSRLNEELAGRHQ